MFADGVVDVVADAMEEGEQKHGDGGEEAEESDHEEGGLVVGVVAPAERGAEAAEDVVALDDGLSEFESVDSTLEGANDE